MLSEEKKKETEPQSLSRREALKALTVATGVVTLSSLPDKWQTPLVEVGTLPAHAQTSTQTSTYIVSNISSSFVTLNNCNPLPVPVPPGLFGSTRTVVFSYNDSSGNVTATTIINYAYDFGTFSGTDLIPLSAPWPPFYVLNVVQTGDGFSGTITLTLCTRFETSTSLQETISITNAAGVTSNALVETTAKPAGAQ